MNPGRRITITIMGDGDDLKYEGNYLLRRKSWEEVRGRVTVCWLLEMTRELVTLVQVPVSEGDCSRVKPGAERGQASRTEELRTWAVREGRGARRASGPAT